MGQPRIEYEHVPCPGCGEESARTVRRGLTDLITELPGEFDLIECRKCSLVRTDPRPTAASVPLCYPGTYPAFNSSSLSSRRSFRWKLQRLYRKPRNLRLGEFPPSDLAPGEVLDIGAGVGGKLSRLQELGWSVSLIEPDRNTALVAQERLGIGDDRVYILPAEELDLTAASFDLILMNHVIEHLTDPVEVLKKCFEWLRPGGMIGIACPNLGSLENRLYGRNWLPHDVPRHLTHFNGETLQAMIQGVGYVEISQSPRADFPPWNSAVAWLRRHYKRNDGSAPGSRSPIGRAAARLGLLLFLAISPWLETAGYSASIEVTARKPLVMDGSGQQGGPDL